MTTPSPVSFVRERASETFPRKFSDFLNNPEMVMPMSGRTRMGGEAISMASSGLLDVMLKADPSLSVRTVTVCCRLSPRRTSQPSTGFPGSEGCAGIMTTF